MKVQLRRVSNGEIVDALISNAMKKDMPLKKDGWQFKWQELAETEGSDFYKLTKVDSPEQVEGLLMLTLIDAEMLYMNNIEVSPSNYGSSGECENVAGNLLAFACYKSFEQGKNYYLGYLSFESKTKLIELYQNQYGATFAMGHKMFFDPTSGKKLMKQYLLIDLNGGSNEEE